MFKTLLSVLIVGLSSQAYADGFSGIITGPGPYAQILPTYLGLKFPDGSIQISAAATGANSAENVGTFDSETPSADGAVISGTNLYLQSASASFPGCVNISTQTFGGVKTFVDAPIVSALTASQAVFTDASKGLVSNPISGTGSVAMTVNPAFTSPNLGTPSAVTLTNATGLPISSGVSGLGSNVAAFLATPSSENLTAAVTNETGSGLLVFGTSPSLTTPSFSSIVNTGTLTLPTSTDTLVGRATTDTLTNKTLTTPIISSISNTGTLTLPTSTDTLVGRATTDTLTNKTLTSPIISSISNTGTLTLPTSTDTLVGRATTDTLTNKTLTSPSLTSPSVTSTAIDVLTVNGSNANNAAINLTSSATGGKTWHIMSTADGNTSGGGNLRIVNTTNSVSAMLIDSTGQVGILNTAPGATLDVTGTGKFSTSVTDPLLIGGTAVSSSLTLKSTSGVGTSDHIKFQVGNNGATEAMRVTTAGKIGIGTSAPVSQFAVRGTASLAPTQYSTGTASQSGTTVTGSGTTFAATMVGQTFNWADGTTSGIITAYTSATSITVTTSQTKSSQAYAITQGLFVDSTGKVGIGNNAPSTAGLDVTNLANPLTDVALTANYPMVLRNESATTGLSTGLAFAVSTDQTLVGGGIVFEREGASSYGNMRFYTRSNLSNVNERMRITNGGKVGIGTTGPSTMLHVDGGTDAVLATAATGYMILGDTAGANIVMDDNEIMARNNGATAPLTLQNEGGNVGIGTNSPNATLDVKNSSGGVVQLITGSSPGVNDSAFLGFGYSAGQTRTAIGYSSGTIIINDFGAIGGTTSSKPFQMNIGGSEKLAIDADGETTHSTTYHNAGTASQSGTTVTGVGTTFTSAMVGLTFRWQDGDSSGLITGFTDSTHLTVTVSQSKSSQNYNVVTNALFIKSDGKVGMGTLSPNSQLHVNGPMATAIRADSGTAVTVAATDSTVLLSGTSGTIVANLPTAASISGRQYTIKRTGTGATSYTVDASGSQTIDGSLTYTLSAQYDFITIQSDGSNWHIISK